MSLPDVAQIRARIYDAYRTTTAANRLKRPALSLEGQLRQYRQRWARFLPPDRSAHILDIGCGGGEFLLFLTQRGYSQIEGVDISPEQIDLARRRGLRQVVAGDALDYLGECRECYALINIQNVLEHLARPELFQMLDAVVAALAPGGRVFGVVPNSKSIFSARVRYADITHELSFTPESLRQIFTVVGLRPTAILEHGPLVHGAISSLRWAIWQGVRLAIWIAYVAENVDYGERVYTHDMMFVAEKWQTG